MTDVKQSFQKLHTCIQNAERILLIAHKKPDGDTTGSTTGMLNYLLREGKDVSAFCLDHPDKQFKYINHIELVSQDQSLFHKPYDLVIVFDSGDLTYCGVDQFIPQIPKGYTLVNLDHHATNTFFGDINIVLTEASSTAEVVYRFFDAMNIRIDSAMATSLLTGLCTDTSNFSNAATNPLAMQAASELIAKGGRFQDILNHVWKNQSLESLKLWGVMLSRLRYNPVYDIASTYLLLSDVDDDKNDMVQGIANFLNATLGTADTMMILKEMPGGKIKGSLRSMNRDISKIAKLLGGGGHKKASGFTVDGRIDVDAKGIPHIVSA